MKKYILYLLPLVLLLTGCAQRAAQHSFPNTSVPVERIELLLNENENGEGTDEANMVLLRELDAEEIFSFLEEVYALPTEKVGTPPPWGYGSCIAKITYENGDVQILGNLNIEFIEQGSSPTGVGSYCFPDDCFQTVFEKYVSLDP